MRPEHIQCIMKMKGETWCGVPKAGAEPGTPMKLPKGTGVRSVLFQSIDHAILAVQQGSRFIPCAACLHNAQEALEQLIVARVPVEKQVAHTLHVIMDGMEALADDASHAEDYDRAGATHRLGAVLDYIWEKPL